MIATTDPTDVPNESIRTDVDAPGQPPGDTDEKNINLETKEPPRDPELAVVDTDGEPATSYEYATPKELSLLSTAFTIATFMIAIDGSILCR